MIGAIIGDIAGSRFEFHNTSDYNFEIFHKDSLFTDDTIFTIAIAETLIDNGDPSEQDFTDHLVKWGRKYLNTDHGRFSTNTIEWLKSDDQLPQRSYGNGAIMRLAPIIYAAIDRAEALRWSIDAVRSSHDHTEALIAAQAITSLGITLYKKISLSKSNMCDVTCKTYYGMTTDDMDFYIGRFDASCQYCTPLALKIFKNSETFEDAIRRAVSFGGDSDTLAAIVGTLAEAHFGVPADMKAKALEYLPAEMQNVINRFNDIYR